MYWQVALVIFAFGILTFIVTLLVRDNSVPDFFRGPGFIVVSLFSLAMGPDLDLRKIIVTVLITLWGLRLAIYIFQRHKGREVDYGYRQMSGTGNSFILVRFIRNFLIYSLLMYLISFPVWYISYHSGEALSTLDSIGLIIFGSGFLLETIADMQLSFFRQNPGNIGKLLTTGVWKYSRHPNLFGEAIVWWGIWFYTLEVPGGWITVISPVTVTITLRFITGVRVLEKKMQRYPGWSDYSLKTAPFVPFIRCL